MFNYVVGSTQRKLDAIKNSVIPAVTGIQNDNNMIVNNINNLNNQKMMVASPPTKNLNVNMLIDNDNILNNNNNNNFNQTGKNPPSWLPQNSIGNLGVSSQGFNRGPNPMPRNTLTSTNIMINNK